MKKMNEVKHATKTDTLINALRKHVGIKSPEWVLITLYDLVVRLSHDEINYWLHIEDKAARSKFLTKAYVNSGINIKDLAKQKALTITNIDISIVRNLMQVIAIEPLPSMEIATELIELWQSRAKGNSMLTMEMADLSYKIISNDERVTEIFCKGDLSADVFALRAGQFCRVYYENRVQEDSQIRQIVNIAGVDVRFPDTEEEHVVIKRKMYQGGFLAGPWNSKALPTESWLGNQFLGAALGVHLLPHMITQVDGRLVCVVTSGWLSRTAASDGKFKKHLIETQLLEAVIQLPSKILRLTSITPALLVINTRMRSKDIQFIDASGDDFTKGQPKVSYRHLAGIKKIMSLLQDRAETEISVLKPAGDVFEMKCNLDVKRYVQSAKSKKIDVALSKFEKVCKLHEIVEIIGCQSIQAGIDNFSNLFPLTEEVHEISAANINQYGMLDDSNSYKRITPIEHHVDRVKKQQLQSGDVIFAVKGSVGKCALIEPKYEGYIANQSFVILRLRKGKFLQIESQRKGNYLDQICLFRFLQSELGQAIVNRLVTGAGVPMIKIMDLKELPVPILEESVLLERIVLHVEALKLIEQKNEIEEKIKEIESHFWPIEVSIT